jgi:hypothetical protein
MAWTVQRTINVLPNNIVLLVTIEKFETNHVLVSVNRLKPYKYMEFKAQDRTTNANIFGIECRWNLGE